MRPVIFVGVPGSAAEAGLLGRTPAAVRELRREQARRIADRRPLPRSSRPPTASRAEPDRLMPVLLELKASAAGADLGKQHAGDPWRLANRLGRRVVRVPSAVLQHPARPRFEVQGRTLMLPGAPIQLSVDLTPAEELKVLAHELGHACGYADERHATAFATAFLGQAPKPAFYAAAAWHDALLQNAIRRIQLERALG